MENHDNTDGIVLLAKKPGLTSFASLNSVKKALGTGKVGHTGTLDSFAQGLLVVCTGRLTRLAGNITEFDKSYDAVIKFGEETDTLEYTGGIVKMGPLPTENALRESLNAFKGNIMQRPPAFSAIHVNGKRASDLARDGKMQELPARPVCVYEAEIRELKYAESADSADAASTDARIVQYALIHFSVSKGTYIRSLARDIAEACGSAAHLVGLYRTKVGHFTIENAAGFSQMEGFSIENAVKEADDWKTTAARQEVQSLEDKEQTPPALKQPKKDWANDAAEIKLREEIKAKKISLDKDTAKLCGFDVINTVSSEAEANFKNGKPLRSNMFDKNLHTLLNETSAAVFTQGGCFIGLIYKNAEGRISYKFVIN